MSRDSNITHVAEKLDQMHNSSNILQRVAASRNLLRLSERLPEKTLDLMSLFADTMQPNNVRRPLAKEQSMKFIIRGVSNRAYKAKAEQLLFKLISDPDEIIRITAFDMAEALIDRDKDLLLRLCNFILERETTPILVERFKRIKGLLSDCMQTT